jgi:hypothetical protein
MHDERTYRTRRSLRIAVALGALFWAGMMVAVLSLPGGRALPAIGAAGFAGFFVCSYLLYARTWISVGPGGIVSSTLRGRRPVPFADILAIVVRDGLGGRVVAVVTRRGLVHFTSLLERDRELLELLLERTELVPRRAG